MSRRPSLLETPKPNGRKRVAVANGSNDHEAAQRGVYLVPSAGSGRIDSRADRSDRERPRVRNRIVHGRHDAPVSPCQYRMEREVLVRGGVGGLLRREFRAVAAVSFRPANDVSFGTISVPR